MHKKKFWLLTPLFGAILFAILYIIATFYYAGGSQSDPNAIGFSWLHNYWCNLLNDEAINGQLNAAQPIALSAMFILCGALAFFWWHFPKFTQLNKLHTSIIRASGSIAMVFCLFLFTTINHDIITNLASFFGLIAMVGTFFGLYKNAWYRLFYFGIVNVLLVILNNFLYYNQNFIVYLPLVQKISFATFLLWIGSINLKMFSYFNKK